MDHKFTELLRQWLEAPADERDYSVGALYLLQLTGNQILYKNLISDVNAKRDHIAHQLQKHYNFRLQELTHEQVYEMEVQVQAIVDEHIPLATQADEQRRGRRADHDALPDEIRAKFTENLSILQRMRELHLRLRSLSEEGSTCPDSYRFPFLKEMITLDKKLHANWKEYDTYVAGTVAAAPKKKKSSQDAPATRGE